MRRRTFIAGSVTLGAIPVSGCLSRFTNGNGRLTVSSSRPGEQTLQIRIAPEYAADSEFTEEITIAETDTRIERDAVVTGKNYDDFFVEVQQEPSGETHETVWEFSCTDTDDRDDQLNILVTE